MGNFLFGFLLGSRPTVILQVLLGIGLTALIVAIVGASNLGSFINVVFWGFVLFCLAGLSMRALELFKPIREAAVRKQEGTAELSNQHFITRVLDSAIADLTADEPAEFEFLKDDTEPGTNINRYLFKITSPSLEELEERTGQSFGAAIYSYSDRDAGIAISFRRLKNSVDTELSSKRSASLQELKNFVAKETMKIVNTTSRTPDSPGGNLHSYGRKQASDGSEIREYMGHRIVSNNGKHVVGGMTYRTLGKAKEAIKTGEI